MVVVRRCGLRKGEKSVVVMVVVVEGVQGGDALGLRGRRLGMGLEVR